MFRSYSVVICLGKIYKKSKKFLSYRVFFFLLTVGCQAYVLNTVHTHFRSSNHYQLDESVSKLRDVG